MTEYYEAHITFNGAEDQNVLGWTYSEIAGDITYGQGKKKYLTKHFSKARWSIEAIREDMEMVSDYLQRFGCEILRNKIELVVYDKRFQ